MIPYNVGECRKHVMQQLRNAAIFAVCIATRPTTVLRVVCVCFFCLTVLLLNPFVQRDAENEGCWTLSPRDEETDSSEIKYYEPQIGTPQCRVSVSVSWQLIGQCLPLPFSLSGLTSFGVALRRVQTASCAPWRKAKVGNTVWII